MVARDAIARVLLDLPSGVVRWASAPGERLPRSGSGVAAVDALLGGGWPRGKVCAVRAEGALSCGATALAAGTVAAATRRGALAAWVDGDASLDPGSLAAAGADLGRVLWVRGPLSFDKALLAAEEVLKAEGFEVLVIRAAGAQRRVRGEARAASWLRLSRAVERARAVVLALGDGTTIPGAFAVRLEGLRARWDGTPGVSAVLLGATLHVAYEDRAIETRMASIEAAPWT